jgi:hypothetical protein
MRQRFFVVMAPMSPGSCSCFGMPGAADEDRHEEQLSRQRRAKLSGT